MKICVPIPFFSLLVSYDMGIWNKKTTLIKINNNEKGFIQVKETILASHQQWNIKKITIFFRSGKSWFGLVNDLGSPDRMSCKKTYNFAFTGQY
jgi:phage antirepressor YoqD-like protein